MGFFLQTWSMWGEEGGRSTSERQIDAVISRASFNGGTFYWKDGIVLYQWHKIPSQSFLSCYIYVRPAFSLWHLPAYLQVIIVWVRFIFLYPQSQGSPLPHYHLHCCFVNSALTPPLVDFLINWSLQGSLMFVSKSPTVILLINQVVLLPQLRPNNMEVC